MDMHTKAVRQKAIGFWLILGGIVCVLFQSSFMLGLGAVLFCWGLVLFIVGRMKQ